jgi:hypothetical protein
MQPTILGFSLTFVFLQNTKMLDFQNKLGPLHTRSQGQKNLGANFEHFWRVLWPQGLQIGFPNLMGPIQGHKVQHLLVTWGQIEKIFFSISALTPSVKALGAEFNFCTNTNA